MRAFAAAVVLLGACAVHEIPRVQWPALGRYKPGKPVLVETPTGMFYVSPKAQVTFVHKDGREITRNWQEITLAKNTLTAISVDREMFSFPLSDLSRVVAHGKPAGELTGVIPDQRPTGPSPGATPGMMGRPYP